MKDDNKLFDLCKQVYGATGWYGSGSAWRDGTPLYSSDYLLEKLPAATKAPFDDNYLILYAKDGKWIADYVGEFLKCKAGTPLKALLKLVLKLHKKGMLPNGGGPGDETL